MDFSTSRTGGKSDGKRIKDAIEQGNCGHFGCCGARVHKGATAVTGITPGTYYAVYFPHIVTITDLQFHNWEDDSGLIGETNDIDGVTVPGGTMFYGDVKAVDLTSASDICVLYKKC